MEQAAIAEAAIEPFDNLVKSDFHAVSLVLNTRMSPTVRNALNQRLSEAQQAEIRLIRAYRSSDPKSIKPRISAGEGWTEASPNDSIQPQQRLRGALADAKTWDDLFDVVAAEKGKLAAEEYTKDFAEYLPVAPEEMRRAYRAAISRNKPLPEDGRGAFAGRMFLAYHKALLSQNLSPQQAANFSREDFINLANADIYAAFEGIPTDAQHLQFFPNFLTPAQRAQITRIANEQLAALSSGSTTAPTTVSGYQSFQEYPNNFRRNLPGHWLLVGSMIGGNRQEIEVRFNESGGAVTTMTANPLAQSPSNYPARVIETQANFGGGSWFKVIINYNNMRFEANHRNDGTMGGEIYDGNNRMVGTVQFYKRIDLDYVNLGRQANSAKNPEAAIHYFSEAIKHRRLADHYADRGALYYNQKNFVAAISDLTEALKLNPRNGSTRYNRMLAYYYNEQYAEALADADIFIAEHSDHQGIADGYFKRGDILWWLKRNEESEKAYATAIRLKPSLEKSIRAANTRTGIFATMAERYAKTNRIMSQLDANIAQSTANLSAANQAFLAAAGAQSATDTQAEEKNGNVLQITQLDATLRANLAKRENRQSVLLTAEQLAALEQIALLIPQARDQMSKINGDLYNALQEKSPGAEAFFAGNNAFGDEDFAQAVQEWHKAASLGHPQAMLNLANHIYLKGVPGVAEKDLQRVRDLTQQAAEAGHPRACANMSIIYSGIYDGKTDHEQGLLWAAKAYEGGYPYAGYLRYYHIKQLRIQEANDLVLRMPGTAEYDIAEQEVADALDSLRQAALLGEHTAMYELALYHYHGRVPDLRRGFSAGRTDPDLPLARFWLEQAMVYDTRETDEGRKGATEIIATIDATLALAKGREWTAADILSALEAGIPQHAIAYMITREKAHLPYNEYARLIAADAWKNVHEHSALGMELLNHITTGADR